MDCLALLKKYTKHKNVAITESGDAALLAALKLVRKVNPRKLILIPDQGGWLTYKDYPKQFGFEAVELRTNRGVINPDVLKQNAINNAAALLITSFAGYYAEQPLKEIINICKSKGCLVIEDVSGSIGDGTLCNGNLADVIIGSFGKWKIVDYGKLGFISSNYAFNINSIEGDSKLYDKLRNAGVRLTKLLRLGFNVKADLEKMGIEVFHSDKRGVNVISAYGDRVIDYCNKNGYEYVICPKYIKVMEKAISIELKRKCLVL